MLLFIKEQSGRTVFLSVECSDTILEVKEAYGRKSGVEPDSMRFIFSGKQLEDDLTLSCYNIQKECTIHNTCRLRGGGGPGFSFSAMEGLEDIPLVEEGPWFLTVSPGINFHLHCKEALCPTQEYGGESIVSKGFGEFDVESSFKRSGDEMGRQCGVHATLKTCGFEDCSWRFEGKAGGQILSGAGAVPADNYSRFRKEPAITWDSLIITVFRTPTSYITAAPHRL